VKTLNAPKRNSQSQITKPSLLQVVKSVLAAAIGVQSKKNYQSDFASSTIVPYVLAGIIFVVLFILILLLWVNSMLA
jgi:hypothetical protein